MKRFGRVLTGEWMFGWGCPNGENLIFWRSVWITTIFWLLGLWLRSWFNAGCPECQVDIGGLWQDGGATVPWLGAIFAAVWASLYARFASDRNYLAGVLNQIRNAQVGVAEVGMYMQTQAGMKDSEEASRVFMHLWQAGFVPDAYQLHLATDPLFGPFILRLLTTYYRQVGAQVDTHTHVGKDGRVRLVKWLVDRGFGDGAGGGDGGPDLATSAKSVGLH